MKYYAIFLVGLGLVRGGSVARADSIWERRNPNVAYLFWDTRARRAGDLLTIVINENTEFAGMEMRMLEKDTKTNAALNLSGAFQAGKRVNHSFSGNFNGAANSTRYLNGTANNTIDRKFTDRMSVQVIQVLPNGNMVVEGYRSRVVAKEERTLRITGIVRPQDIGAGNLVQSQYIANVTMTYVGRGQESSYQDNGWLGRIANVIWPF